MSLLADKIHPIMCITQDNLPLTHAEQARRLCRAGAKWIQLRMKAAEPAEWLSTARLVAEICSAHGAVCVINDNVDIALASGAHGVHLGRTDEDWTAARRRLGPHRILGGTVNNEHDAIAAASSACLDYVGVGPWRFTATKKNLPPVLGVESTRTLLRLLGGIPAWVIGGVVAADLAGIRAAGAAGAAVSSALFRDGAVEENYRRLASAWLSAPEPRGHLSGDFPELPPAGQNPPSGDLGLAGGARG